MLTLKLKVQEKSHFDCGPAQKPQVAYKLIAVYGPGNEQWARFTPSGTLAFTVTNPEAPELEVGAEYIVTLSPVKKL